MLFRHHISFVMKAIMIAFALLLISVMAASLETPAASYAVLSAIALLLCYLVAANGTK